MEAERDLSPAAALLRDFVNTYEPQLDREAWQTPSDLRDWLAARRLIPADGRLLPTDVATAVTIREGLRGILLSHARSTTDEGAVQVLNQTLSELPLRLTFTDGGYRLSSAVGTPIGRALGELADAIRQSTEDGSWSRLKVCARDSCHWAFYDASRNQVRRWCSMATCGNHLKMQRAYAARKRRIDRASAGPAASPGVSSDA